MKTDYAAFLRAINVGGHQQVKMETLRKIFEDMGFSHVRTVIQSGNVLFTATAKSTDALTRKVEAGLKITLGFEVPVFVRTVEELRAMIKSEPFHKADSEAKRYVAFLPRGSGAEALSGKKVEGAELVKVEADEVFLLSFRMKDGRYGDFGKLLRVPATIRNWNTLCRMVE